MRNIFRIILAVFTVLISGYCFAAINFDPSKIDKLKGTWIIDHSNHRDRLSVKETVRYQSSGEYVGSATYYPDSKPFGFDMVCAYGPSKYVQSEGEFVCFGDDINSWIQFEYFDDRLKNAKFMLSKESITGYRESLDTNKYWVYQSNYNIVQWDFAGNNNAYCIDITDENGNVYPGFRAIRCGENMLNFSPIDYVHSVLHIELPSGLTFWWKVWSAHKDEKGVQSNDRYGGPGYEGKVVVP